VWCGVVCGLQSDPARLFEKLKMIDDKSEINEKVQSADRPSFCTWSIHGL